MLRLLVVVLFLTFATAPMKAGAEDVAAKLQEVRSELNKQKKTQQMSEKKVKELNKEIATLKKRIVTAARNVSAYEASLNTLEDEAQSLEKAQGDLNRELQAKMQKTVALMAALENLASRPTFAVFAVPLPLKDTINSASLMKSTVPLLSEQAEELQAEMSRLASLKMAIRAKRSQIKTAAKGLAEKQKELSDLVAKKNAQQKKYAAMGKQAENKYKQLAEQAKDLEDLLAKIEKQRALEEEKREKERKEKEKAEALARERAKAEAMEKSKQEKEQKAAVVSAPREVFEHDVISDADFERAKGMISSPVAGKVIESFGDLAANGMHNKGIKLQTRTNAQVLSPYDGVVLFSGYLKGYGKLLIIEHSKSYYSMLSGMEEVDVEEGQTLLAGEPVGMMAAEGEPVLYMELRKKGVPINPVPWLALKN